MNDTLINDTLAESVADFLAHKRLWAASTTRRRRRCGCCWPSPASTVSNGWAS